MILDDRTVEFLLRDILAELRALRAELAEARKVDHR